MYNVPILKYDKSGVKLKINFRNNIVKREHGKA